MKAISTFGFRASISNSKVSFVLSPFRGWLVGSFPDHTSPVCFESRGGENPCRINNVASSLFGCKRADW